jgi:organic hydroperoxide reductase OsmC/OhrA
MATVNLGFNLDQLQKLVSAVKDEPASGQTVWEVDTNWKGGFKSEATVKSYGRHHTIRMDEPTVLGGSDTAPNMVEVVLGAYGCCLTTGYVMNAAQRGIKLEGVEVRLKGNLDLRGFFGLSNDVTPGYKGIEVEVTLDAPGATQSQLEELHAHVVRTSPVGSIISRPVAVEPKLARAG